MTESLRTILNLIGLNYDEIFTPREKEMFKRKKNAYLRYYYESNKHVKPPKEATDEDKDGVDDN